MEGIVLSEENVFNRLEEGIMEILYRLLECMEFRDRIVWGVYEEPERPRPLAWSGLCGLGGIVWWLGGRRTPIVRTSCIEVQCPEGTIRGTFRRAPIAGTLLVRPICRNGIFRRQLCNRPEPAQEAALHEH